MKYELRDYQQEAVDKTYDYWRNGVGSNPIIVAPTGAGKSLIIAKIIDDAMSYEGTRVMVLSHVKELLQQNAEKIININPKIINEIGFYSAGLKQKKLNRRVTFAGIQSIWKKAYSLIPPPDIIIIDEAHLMPRDVTTRYGKFISDVMECNKKLKIVGLTATHYRMDSGLLHEGKGAIFDGVSYDISITELIEMGYLSPIACIPTNSLINPEGINKVAGEFNQKKVAFAACDEALIADTVDEIVTLGADRKSWLVFSSGVNHGEKIAQAIRDKGISVVTVFGDDSNEDRANSIKQFKNLEVRCMVNCGVLTTGFDAPAVDLIAIVRMTASTGLYVQIVGRGTRISPETGKTDCLLLDFGGNVERHGFIDQIKPTVKEYKEASDVKEEAPVRKCPECNAFIQISISKCPDCNFEFPSAPLNHNSTAYRGAVMSTQVDSTWSDVISTTYYRHKKIDKPDSIKVTYSCGMRQFNEWLCPDHEGYAKQNYINRKIRLGASADTTDDALLECNSWNNVLKIKHRPDGNFTKIEDVIYENRPPKEPQLLDDEIPFSNIPF